MDAPRAVEVERRIVSVLFADLVGFTPLSERLDAEDVASIQDAYFAAVRETVARYGGRVEKFIGDAAMAVFGLPATREDDAERAVRAGLAIVAAVEALAGRLGLQAAELQVRVGINSGEAVAAMDGPDAGRVTGDTVNTAARLQAAAPPGGVLVGDATALAVAAAIELAPAEPVALKGKGQPVMASLARGARLERSRELAMGELRAPLIGRAVQLAQIADVADRAAQPGGHEALLLIAPPGVGKTRLLEEFARGLRDAVVLRARVRADIAAPFEPVLRLFESLGIEIDNADDLAATIARAGLPSARSAVIAGDIRALRDPAAAASGSSDQAGRFDGLATGLDALVLGRPAIWLVEDLHWAAPDLLAFLDVVARSPAPSGRMILATARPSILERLDAADPPAGATSWSRVELPPLEGARAAELVTALVGSALPAPLVERIVERSDGNCLFIEELLRTWIGVGTLVPDGHDGWRLAIAPEDAPLPTTVQAIYAAQIDDLPDGARAVARRASVAGRRFPVRALGVLGADDAEGSLGPLRRRTLISGPHAEPAGGVGYAYRHALLRDAGYASLARAERARLHLRLAGWLEATAGPRAGEMADAIARHLDAALSSAPALSAEVADGVHRDTAAARAAAWFERAGDAAREQFANEAARAAYRRAVELTPETMPLDLARRWQRLGEATSSGGKLEEAADALDTARQVYDAALDPLGAPPDARAAARRGLSSAAAALAHVRYAQVQFAATRDIADAALDRIGNEDAAARVPLLLARLRGLEGLTNEYASLHAQARDVLVLAEATGDEALVLDARHAALAFGHSAGVTQPSEWLDFSADAERAGRAAEAVGAVINAAGLLLDTDSRAAGEAAGRAQALAEARGLSEHRCWIQHLRTELGLQSGDWQGARAAGVAGLEVAETHGYDRAGVRTWFALVPIATATRDIPLAERARAWFAARAGRFPGSPYGLVNHTAVDLRLADVGVLPMPTLDPDSLLPGLGIADAAASWLSAVERIVEGLLVEGRLEAAEAAVSRFLAAEQSVTPLLAASRALVRAMLDRAAGRVAAAIDAASEAGTAAEAANAPWWRSRAIRLLASLGAGDAERIDEADAIEVRLGIPSAARAVPPRIG